MDYQQTQFNIKYSKSLNNIAFFVKYRETNIESGFLLFGLDSTLSPLLHNKIVVLLEDLAENYLLSQNLKNPGAIFEQSLHEFNVAFNKTINEHKNWTKKLNLTIALIENNNLHFVNFGYNHLLLIKPKHIVDITKEMSATSTIVGQYLFDQIYTGKVDNFNRVAICNQILLDYISNDKLKDALSLLPLLNIEAQLEFITQATNSQYQIAGVIIQKSHLNDDLESTNLPTPVTEHQSSVNSIDNLLNTSNQTAKLLNPQLIPNIKKIKNLIIPDWIKKQPKLKDYKEPKSSAYLTKFKSTNKLKDFYSKFSNILLKTKHTASATQDRIRSLPFDTKFFYNNFSQKIKKLPRSSKILLFVALLLIAVLTYNIANLGLNKRQQVKYEFYQQILGEINLELDEADAAIIYGNNEKARELIHSTLNKISELPQNNEERINTYNDLFNRNRQLYNDVNAFTDIPSPIVILDSQKFTDSKPKHLYFYEDSLIILTDQQILDVNPDTKEIVSTDLTQYDITEYQLSTGEDNILWLLAKNNLLYRYDINTQTFAATETTINQEKQNLIGLGNYNKRIYALDSNNNEVWRLDKLTNIFTTPKPWFKDEYDISNSQGFTIDGSIYIIQNSTLQKFTQGRLTDFALETIEPDLTNAKVIKTNPDIPYLYILDNNNKRLIIFNKDGTLAQQYTSEKFDNLKDFTFDYKPDNNQTLIYLLNGTEVFQIAINE